MLRTSHISDPRDYLMSNNTHLIRLPFLPLRKTGAVADAGEHWARSAIISIWSTFLSYVLKDDAPSALRKKASL